MTTFTPQETAHGRSSSLGRTLVSWRAPQVSKEERPGLVETFTKLVDRFAASGPPEDAPVAIAAYAALRWIGNFDHASTTTKDPATLNRLASAYVEQVKSGIIGRTPGIEGDLGIDPAIFRIVKVRKKT